MIKVKSLFDQVEADDGARLWVERIGLTRDLVEWCRVDHHLPHVAPPEELARWFENHPDEYQEFRGRYHEWLNQSDLREPLGELACAAIDSTFTLLHSDERKSNAATALAEFLAERQGWCEESK